MSRQSTNNWKDVKPRNILTLEERINVIRAYEKKPIYQKIAYMFKCSTKQIKNIIANRESILLYYANLMVDGSNNEVKRKRQQKIAFLGKVMYEFLRRVQGHRKDLTLGTHLIRSKALEVKEALDIPNFYPNNAWMQNFKTEYNLPDFETPVIMRGSNNIRNVPSSILTEDIIAYVRIHDKQYSAITTKTTIPFEAVAPHHDESNGESNKSAVNEIVFLESAEEDNTANISKHKTHHNKLLPTKKSPSTTYSVPVKQIKSYRDAVQYLRPLEDFALLQENYRAIGLISQLELVFHNPPRNQEV